MIRSGAMDCWSVSRAVLFASIDKALKLAEQSVRNQTTGQHDLFSVMEQSEESDGYVEVADWEERDRLNGEKETLGLYLTGHPIDQFRQEFEKYTPWSLAKVTPCPNKKIIVYGLVVSVRKIITKRGKKMAVLTIDDATSRLDVTCFSEVFEQKHDLLAKDEIVVVEGEATHDDFNGGIKMVASSLYSVMEARSQFARHLRISLNNQQGELLDNIGSLLQEHPGVTPVIIEYHNQNACAKIALGKAWQVNPCNEIIGKLAKLLGNAELVY